MDPAFPSLDVIFVFSPAMCPFHVVVLEWCDSTNGAFKKTVVVKDEPVAAVVLQYFPRLPTEEVPTSLSLAPGIQSKGQAGSHMRFRYPSMSRKWFNRGAADIRSKPRRSSRFTCLFLVEMGSLTIGHPSSTTIFHSAFFNMEGRERTT